MGADPCPISASTLVSPGHSQTALLPQATHIPLCIPNFFSQRRAPQSWACGSRLLPADSLTMTETAPFLPAPTQDRNWPGRVTCLLQSRGRAEALGQGHFHQRLVLEWGRTSPPRTRDDIPRRQNKCHCRLAEEHENRYKEKEKAHAISFRSISHFEHFTFYRFRHCPV